MILNNIFQLWSKMMEVKKSKAVQRAVSDFLSIDMIAVEMDKESATRTKESAQKILGIMIASLYTRGRPSKKSEEVLNYGI